MAACMNGTHGIDAMQTETRLPRPAIAAAVNTRLTMNDRSRRPASMREKHAARLRSGAAAAEACPVSNLPRLIGGAILVLALLLIAVGAATAHEFSSKDITVAHPWARATPGGVTVGGAYFEIKAAPGQGRSPGRRAQRRRRLRRDAQPRHRAAASPRCAASTACRSRAASSSC